MPRDLRTLSCSIDCYRRNFFRATTNNENFLCSIITGALSPISPFFRGHERSTIEHDNVRRSRDINKEPTRSAQGTRYGYRIGAKLAAAAIQLQRDIAFLKPPDKLTISAAEESADD